MKKKSPSRTMLTAVAVASSLLFAFGAQAQNSVPASAAEGGRAWFVELSGAPVADGTTLAAARSEKAAFRRAALATGVRFKERREFNTLFNGFSVEVDAVNRLKILRMPGVKAMYPVNVVSRPVVTADSSTPMDAGSLPMIGADIAQNQLGLSGKGVLVGIIDTGIDIDHPAFGGTGVPGTTPFPNARVVAGYDLVGDNYDAAQSGDHLIPVPDPIPDDCAGHGTHVSGIVGANGGGVLGVAPKASLAMYRVFGCTGSTEDDVILEALERAQADGVQVINMSLGNTLQWPEYPTAQASSRLVNKGIVVVTSIGNSGPTGGPPPDALFAAGAPGVGDKVIGVASFDNQQIAFSVAGTPYGFNPATGAPLPPTSGSLPMAKTGTPTATSDGCTALPAGSLAGQAVLIRRGTCSFFIKASNAMNAGAAAVVLYNNAAGALNPTVAGTPAITIPVVAVTAAQGATLDGLIAAGPTTLNWSNNYVSFPFGTGGLISGFSSFGLTAELTLKPNIGAPGGGILSTFPLELGGTAVLSGTSMASPHVAGAAALILEAKPNLNSNQMMGRMQNVADPKNWSGNAALGLLDHTFRQGAGMLDVVGTVTATATVSPSQFSTGESASGSTLQTLTVRNLSVSPASYTIGHVAGVAAGPNTTTGANYALSGVFDAPATVSFSKTTLNIGPLGSASVDVTVTANPALPDRSLYGGYVTLTPVGAGTKMSVPYAGMKGDYQSTQVLLPTANGFPWLAKLAGTTYTSQPGGATYTLADGDVPYFLMHLDHLSRELKFEVFDVATGKSFNKISDDEFVTRNSTPGGFFASAWDGVTFKGSADRPRQIMDVPNGTYVVKMSVLKALGDSNNPAHWETWTSPAITIARP